MQITILAKKVYGEMKFYPVCEKAHLFANIAGTCTLTRRSIDSIKALGVEIIVQQEAVTV